MTILDRTPPPVSSALAERTARQLAQLDAFHKARRITEQAAAAAAASRERRMDSARRLEILRREHEAILERTELALRRSGQPLRCASPTAIVAHRQEWFTGKVTEALRSRGVEVLAHTDVGADAVGWAVVEQPDLVLVDDTLAMLPGEDVVREIRRYCPGSTVIGALVPYSDRVGAMLDAGASTVHVRSIPPAQVVDELVALLPV